MGVIRELERSFGVLFSRFVAFFIVFGGPTLRARRKFMVLGGLQVGVVHGFSSTGAPRPQPVGRRRWLR
jgi:hypothetical protein